MSRTKQIALTAGTLVVGAALATGVTGIANAADSTPSPSSSSSAAAPDRPTDGFGRHGHGGPGGLHGGPGLQALHSEAVVKAADGTFSTVTSIRGSVTAVSATSITVKAEDGFSATYAINSDTEVRTGVPTRPSAGSSAPAESNIADVKVGDVASVRGTAGGSSATAISIHSMTAAQAAQLEADRVAHTQDD
ncbi:MAG: hypothetical protein PSX37_11680 [bacterium]|nr:hypothetical protein [bacterium]